MEKLNEEQLLDCAQMSVQAEFLKKSMPQLILKYPNLTRDEAYEIQTIREKLITDMGHRLIGYKMGSTSMQKRRQMGSVMCSYGRLFDYMLLNQDAPLKIEELIHPKAEPEITFVLKHDLTGPNVTSAEVMYATDYVVASLEIIDSRYDGFKFTGPDAVADNISGSRVKLGSVRLNPNELDLALLGVKVSVNGEDLEFGTGAAVLGHPARSVAELANMVYKQRGAFLRAGQIIMTGGITAARALKPGDKMKACFAYLGTIELGVI